MNLTLLKTLVACFVLATGTVFYKAVEFINAIVALASCVDEEKRAFRMYDVERANVYTKHLGEKLR